MIFIVTKSNSFLGYMRKSQIQMTHRSHRALKLHPDILDWTIPQQFVKKQNKNQNPRDFCCLLELHHLHQFQVTVL